MQLFFSRVYADYKNFFEVSQAWVFFMMDLNKIAFYSLIQTALYKRLWCIFMCMHADSIVIMLSHGTQIWKSFDEGIKIQTVKLCIDAYNPAFWEMRITYCV